MPTLSTRAHARLLAAALVAASPLAVSSQSGDAALAPPAFHHLHVNAVDPDAVIAAYLKLWPATTRKTTVEGYDALANGQVYLLFTRVSAAPPAAPQSAYRHQVWLTPNVREYVARARAAGMKPMPLYTSEEGGAVEISSDTFPGTLTRAGLAEARQKGVAPTRQAGYTYVSGPEGLVVEGFERAGDTERLAQIDMWQDDPVCAELWYAEHLGATRRPARGAGPAPTPSSCKVAADEPTWPSNMREGTRRSPSGRAAYGNVALFWYTKPGDRPLVSTLGQAVDHLAFTVTDLDAWLAKLEREGVTIARRPYAFGSSRAILIEGPSREAIELVEQKR